MFVRIFVGRRSFPTVRDSQGRRKAFKMCQSHTARRQDLALLYKIRVRFKKKQTRVQSNLAKGRIAFLSPLAAAHSSTSAGKQCRMHPCVGSLQWVGTCHPSKSSPFRGGSG